MRKTNRIIAMMLVLVMATGLMVGCARTETEEEEKAPVETVAQNDAIEAGANTKEEAVDGGTLVLSMDKAPTSLDPLKISGYNAFVLATQIGDPLVAHDASGNGEYLPSLATSWEVSEDGMQWVFQIRDDVHFQKGKYQDGRLMTAEDVAYSINRNNKQNAN